MKLTSEQQEMVIKHVPYVSAVAYRFWRWSHLPVRYLEDLKAEAIMRLCGTIVKYNPNKGMSLRVKLALDAKGWMSKAIRRIRNKDQPTVADIPNGELLLESIITDEIDNSRIDVLLSLLPRLTPRQREVIEKRFGLGGLAPMSLTQVADATGISYRSVRYDESKAILKLQEGVNNAVA